jgi:hypothetical protein
MNETLSGLPEQSLMYSFFAEWSGKCFTECLHLEEILSVQSMEAEFVLTLIII